MTARNPDPANADTSDPEKGFEEFTASSDWRALPLKIKLMVVNMWRTERDVPPSPTDARNKDRN